MKNENNPLNKKKLLQSHENISGLVWAIILTAGTIITALLLNGAENKAPTRKKSFTPEL